MWGILIKQKIMQIHYNDLYSHAQIRPLAQIVMEFTILVIIAYN